jgi:hypothetical protein
MRAEAAAGVRSWITCRAALPPHARTAAEQARLDERMVALRAEQKRLTKLLADKGGTPDVGEGMLGAMLSLKG